MAPPFSVACLVKTNDLTVAQDLVTVSDEGNATTNCHRLALESNVNNNKIRAYSGDPAWGYAETSVGIVANTWYWVCGVWAAVDDRRVYLSGGNKGTDATSITPVGIDYTAIGALVRAAVAVPMSGAIALPSVWKCILTDQEVAALYRGVPPWTIQPWAFVALWPLRFNRTWDRDIAGRGGYHMTPVNGPTWADDPPVVRKMWEDLEHRRYRGQPIREKPIYTAEIVWGHDTGVLETTVRDLQHNWDGTGDVVNPGVADTEAMKLASGEYMIGEITYTGAVDITITYNVYAAGDNINLDYRHGATPAACEAAAWNDYVAGFTSLGYVQARVTSTL
jgi:hypothetical protein